MQPKKSLIIRLLQALFHYIRRFLRAVFPIWRLGFFYRLRWAIPPDARKKHTYILGGSGSGKSEFIKALILDQIKHTPRQATVFLLDPHGDIASEVAQFKEHATGEGLIYLTPDLNEASTFCINPLDTGNGQLSAPQINYISECLTEVFKEIVGSEAQITANMGTLLNAVLSVLLRRKNTTLLDLQRFMRDDENQDLVDYAIQHSTQGQRHFFCTAFYDRNYTPTKNALYTKLQSLLNSETFYRLTIGKSTLNLREAMNSRKTVVFNLSKGLIGQQTAPAFGRFIVGLVQGFSFERQSLAPQHRIPVHLFIDEFQNFITPSIQTILAESRKYAVYLTLAQQFYGQDTSTNLRNAIVNNTAVKITGTGEGASLEAVQKMMNGVSKEALQNLETGHFFIKVKSHSILQKHLSGNRAQVFQMTTAYLGHRHAMKAKHWQAVKKDQQNRYYKPLETLHNTTSAEVEQPPIAYPIKHQKTPITPKFSL